MGSNHQEIFYNIQATNVGAIKYTKQMLTDLNTLTDKNIIIAIIIIGDFSTLNSTMGRSSRHEINRKMLTLNHTLDQMHLTDKHRTFHPTTEYTFFSCTHETFPIIYHMVCHQRREKKKQNTKNYKQT